MNEEVRLQYGQGGHEYEYCINFGDGFNPDDSLVTPDIYAAFVEQLPSDLKNMTMNRGSRIEIYSRPDRDEDILRALRTIGYNPDPVYHWEQKTSSEPGYVQPYLQRLNPDEVHGAGGDCKNPYCNYQFTADDRKEIYHNEGYFTCPKCDMTFDYNTSPGDHLVTRLGLTPTQMGDIGEDIVDNMVNIPGVGPVVWRHDTPQSPLDFVIGQYGVEVKTNHSEAQPRFKLGGSYERGQKIQKAMEMGLTPALIGVRLNFYRDKADLFFRPQMSDTWIGQGGLEHIGQVDFSDLNPFRRPEDVPPASDLPDDDGG